MNKVTELETFVSSDPHEISVIYDALQRQLEDLHHGLYEGSAEEKKALGDLWERIYTAAHIHGLIY